MAALAALAATGVAAPAALAAIAVTAGVAATAVAADVSRRPLVAPLAALTRSAGTVSRARGVRVDAPLLADGPVSRATVSARVRPGVTDCSAALVPVTGSLAARLVSPLPIRAAAAPVAPRVPTGHFPVFGPARAVTALLRRSLPAAPTGGPSPATALIRCAPLSPRVARRSGPIVGPLATSQSLGLLTTSSLAVATALFALPSVTAGSLPLITRGSSVLAALTSSLLTALTSSLLTPVAASPSIGVAAALLTARTSVATGVPLLALIGPLTALQVDRNLRTLLSLWRIRVSRHVRNEPVCALERRAGHGREIERAGYADVESSRARSSSDRNYRPVGTPPRQLTRRSRSPCPEERRVGCRRRRSRPPRRRRRDPSRRTR